MFPNLKVLATAALVPLFIWLIWYSPFLFGKAWLKAAGLNMKKMQGVNILLVFALTYVLSLVASVMIYTMVIHQTHFFSLLGITPGAIIRNDELRQLVSGFMSANGNNFRTFGHGMFHGAMGGLLIVTPIIATNALFERKGFKYIAINGGYWVVSLACMGAIISKYA